VDVSITPSNPAKTAGDLQTLIIGSSELTLGVEPKLGGKIVSLMDVRSGVNWMWAPPFGCGLFRNAPTDSFSQSTLTGADECFPTVAACSWNGRQLPDHGEVWAVPWQIVASSGGSIELEVRTHVSPFVLRRRIDIVAATARFRYILRNIGNSPEAFLWAFHPLLRFDAGDYLELPATSARIDSQINTSFGARGSYISLPEPVTGVHLDHMDFGPFGAAAVKFFTDSLDSGRVALVRPAHRRRLVFEFDNKKINTIGVWMNTGGWEGYRHVAIEPTNGAPDPLDVAANWNRCQRITPGEILSWEFTMRLEDFEVPIKTSIS
jgi:galactose mutarotase-like enzyme